MLIFVGCVIMAVGFAVYGIGLAVECVKAMLDYRKEEKDDVIDTVDDED